MRRLDKDYEAYKEIEQRRMLAILLSEEDEAEAEEGVAVRRRAEVTVRYAAAPRGFGPATTTLHAVGTR